MQLSIGHRQTLLGSCQSSGATSRLVTSTFGLDCGQHVRQVLATPDVIDHNANRGRSPRSLSYHVPTAPVTSDARSLPFGAASIMGIAATKQ
jgi:hypothetical protein